MRIGPNRFLGRATGLLVTGKPDCSSIGARPSPAAKVDLTDDAVSRIGVVQRVPICSR